MIERSIVRRHVGIRDVPHGVGSSMISHGDAALSSAAVWRRWSGAWMGGAVIGIVNGTLREVLYRGTGERRAHQISTGTLVAALATYFWLLDRRWPIPTTAAALQIGATWTASTMAFEFGFGRYVGPNPKSWSEMLGDYDITKGQLWPLVIAFELVGPLRSALRDCGWDADLRGVRGIIHRWSPRSAP